MPRSTWSQTKMSEIFQEENMAWSAPIVSEICVGMEVTSYESAEIDTFN